MSLTAAQEAQLCPTCVEVTASTRYCARFRCLCGHETCPAFASYIPRRPVLALVPAPSVPPRETSAWDTREEPTWIDSM